MPTPPDYPGLPPAVSVFEPPTFLGKEDIRAYSALLEQVSADVNPRDSFERMWIADIVYLQVEIFKLRRIKNALAQTGLMADGIQTLLLAANKDYNKTAGSELSDIERMARAWLNGQLTERDLDRFLSAWAEKSNDAVKARAFANELSDLLRIDHMMIAAEKRRNTALREIDRHRETLGKKLRKALPDFEEAEFEVVAQDGKMKKSAA